MRSVKGFVDGLLVEIYDKAKKDEEASKDSDVPIFKTMTYIKKKAVNSRDIYDQPMTDDERRTYSKLYAAFEDGAEVVLDGTPLEEWPLCDAAMIETLKSINVFTIQAAATIPETSAHRLPLNLKNISSKAKKYLSQGHEAEELRKQNADLLKRIEALESNQKKKPGRPRKTA